MSEDCAVPAAERVIDEPADETHVESLKLSPVDAEEYVMWCGLVATFDEQANASVDFYGENAWFKASCAACKAAFRGTA